MMVTAPITRAVRAGAARATTALLLSVLAACSATPAALPSAPPATPPPPPTPIIVYVTPAPTPEPVEEPVVEEEEPIEEPEATPVPRPSSYRLLTAHKWRLLTKSPDNYVGRGYVVFACVFQFDAATGDDAFLAYSSYRRLGEFHWFSDGENSKFTGSASKLGNVVEDDVVEMKVVAAGSYSYETQAGGNTTVPQFEVTTIRRRGSC